MMNIRRDGEPWTAEEDAVLGTDADRVIAVRLGRSSVAVANRRKKLDIRRKVVVLPACDAALAAQTNGQAAIRSS